MAQRITQTAKYWVEDFQLGQSDINHLYNVLLENETPLAADEMAFVLVVYRVQNDTAEPAANVQPGAVYHPAMSYAVGDTMRLPALGDVRAQVVSKRAGENPDYGEFTVVEVELENGSHLELATEFGPDHILNAVEDEPEEEPVQFRTAEELFIDYGGYVADAIEEALENHDDLVRLAGRWFPRSLLAKVTVGHLNLAEAVLDLVGGGPLSTTEILEQIGIPVDENPRLAEFSMNYALQEDERFDEVGPSGRVLWYLRRMEPQGVLNPPPALYYEAIEYDPASLHPELREIELEIGDEHTKIPARRGPIPDSVTVTLTYPHLRAGTMPLSLQLRRMFPTAYQSPRIRFNLIDAATDEDIPGWVVRTHGYVYGLQDWFKEKDIPIGGYLTVTRTESPGQVKVNYAMRRNPRVEWVRTMLVEDHRIRFEERSRPIGCDYDEQLIIDVENPKAVDAYAERLEKQKTTLAALLDNLVRELTALNPQGNVHSKTVYSAVNVLRRCPPGPIFTTLQKMPQFEYVGGGYWRVVES